MCVGAFLLSREGAKVIGELSEQTEAAAVQQTILIDAGHGGHDPGKVGVNDALEKDINLAIAFKLKTLLESEGYAVVMTREEDIALHEEEANNKKVSDMNNRVAMIDECDPVVTISIHQNSYHEEYVKGAQVFYYTHSTEGQKLAELVQAQLIETLDPENTRTAKANDSYYLLKKTETPVIVVESGFLSNQEEAALLVDDNYQEQIAWAIHMGIQQYINAM